jgi:TolB-like protein/Flp pilus assembly protein TadD/predicted Ser/Thr protein kinase
MTLAPGTKLGPYEILAAIGSGGMGEVWKARDTRLGRIVAIKMVKEQHSERFKQEAKSIAALNHPYICQLFDIGPDYLVLEYVEGKPLSSPLPEREAVRLAIQIATALEAAHKKGIIHRDLKPANIMVTDEGSVKLLDFGLAKLYEQDASISSSPTADFPATQAGAVLGTVAYMSPEQAQGQPAHARSDIFSFGLVLYEMLSGRRAFAGDSTPEIMAALLRDEPPLLQASSAVEKIMRRCLAKQPSARYQTMAEVKAALEQVLAEKPTFAAAEPQPSIAVLPFVNMSGDKEQEYFSDGLAEEIINALTHIPGLRVIARTSAFAFKGKQEDIRKIAEILGVTNILEGSVRKAGNRIRVTAQLVTAADGSHLWSERYDREMTDIFAIQDEISQAIAEKLRIRLSPGHPRVKRYTENLAAYDLCLKARYYILKMTQEGRETGRRYCEQAITLDPSYALAYVVLAESYLMNAFWGSTDPREAFSRAKSAALEALSLDDTIADAHSALGTVLGSGEFDWHAAEREFHRAQELNPSSVAVRYDYAWCYAMWFLLPLGLVEQALTEMRRALQLDPLDPFCNSLLGCLLYLARQFEPAVAQLRHAVELDPTFFFSYWLLSVAYQLSGQLDEAIAAAQRANELSGGHAVTMGVLGAVYGRVGRIAEARQLLAELTERRRSIYVPASALAFLYGGLGEQETTLQWIARSIEERDPIIVTSLKISPTFDPLRSHPRYRALLRKMNLEA